MASGLYFIVLLCLTSVLWAEARPHVQDETAGVSETCPSGWTQFEQRCYIFYNNGKDWADAELFCTSIGGNLASIHNADELSFLRKIIKDATGSDKTTWVGGYDAVKEGVWLWSDGSKFDYKPWSNGEPNNAGGESCMEINWSGKFVNDVKCHKRSSFICAKNP